MEFRSWLMLGEEQSQDALFLKTDKSGLGPKPSTNAGLAKPSDGWLRGKGQPALFMKKKMHKESALHGEMDADPYGRAAKEMCSVLDVRPGSLGENSKRGKMEQESLKILHKYFGDVPVDWSKLEGVAKSRLASLYGNYSREYIATQEAKMDAILSYLPKYFGNNQLPD